jgi:hypothetical protein
MEGRFMQKHCLCFAQAILGGLFFVLAFPPVGWWWVLPLGLALLIDAMGTDEFSSAQFLRWSIGLRSALLLGAVCDTIGLGRVEPVFGAVVAGGFRRLAQNPKPANFGGGLGAF